jgi:hypothetical protein
MSYYITEAGGLEGGPRPDGLEGGLRPDCCIYFCLSQ